VQPREHSARSKIVSAYRGSLRYVA